MDAGAAGSAVQYAGILWTDCRTKQSSGGTHEYVWSTLLLTSESVRNCVTSSVTQETKVAVYIAAITQRRMRGLRFMPRALQSVGRDREHTSPHADLHWNNAHLYLGCIGSTSGVDPLFAHTSG